MASEAASAPGNTLLSTQPSELQAVLHPLVLLSISDYITRHTLREQEGPIVGGILGQHNGREVTMEHAFDCFVDSHPRTPSTYRLNIGHTNERIEQLRLVHKDRNLDFVGWYTLIPKAGPFPDLMHIHNDFLKINESAILLGFDAGEIQGHSVGGKLPLTVYESSYEVDDSANPDTEGDNKMLEEGEEAPEALKLRFREIAYTVETGEAEMISVDFVARGSGNATFTEPPSDAKKKQQASAAKAKGKGKSKAASDAEDLILSPEDEELIAALTAKANAIKMLHSRINLVSTYLARLPSAYVSGEDLSATPAPGSGQTTPSNVILRQIQALVGRLDLIEPSDIDAFRREIVCEENDVQLVSLLNDIMQSVNDVRTLGRRFEIIEAAKTREQRSKLPVWDSPGGGSGGFILQGAGDLML
ncbi:COP9 signalosome complex subunit 6 [Plectosphaerella cucumerina]|uniref:COP9 signalosome complex subunit 6 n=1 Tax=Plectosphaerella cucumerina TaxID=40658 RepID=A0A8K0X7U6_9PEZI|nr:COP9 signalosome complex subunit 6 [Plectosphaerella cucumerina]